MTFNDLKKTKVTIGILILSLCLQCSFSIVGSAATNVASSKTDIVLVVDASKSMEKSDPQSISIEGMKMFIDMCHVQGDKIGLVAYSDGIVKESDLKAMDTAEDKQTLKNTLNNIQLGQWTDIGLGLKRVIEILDTGRDPSHKPLIVLLSDGKNDPSRNKQASENDLTGALKSAKDKNYPIYTIGLNADGSVDKNLLEKVAMDTNAKNFITDTANDLPPILREIFANTSQLKIIKAGTLQANGQYQDVKINIPDSNVVEANISLLSSNPVEVKLFDSKGAQQDIPSQNIIFSTSKKYSMIKILTPSQGDWLLKVKGISGDAIDINLLFNYELQVLMNLDPNSNINKGDRVKINSFLISNNQKLQDTELYKNMTAKLLVKDLAGKSTKEVPLTNKDDNFQGEYVVPDEKKYELTVKVEGPGFYRESDAVTIGTGNTTPQVSKKVESISILSIVIYSLVALIFIGIAVFLFMNYKKKNKKFVGEVILQTREESTGKMGSPQYRKLSNYKGSVTMHHLLDLAPEWNETAKIIFMPGKGDTLILKNKSTAIVQQYGMNKDASKGLELSNNIKIIIILKETERSITMEYVY